MTIGDRIRQLRGRLTQEEFGTKLGISGQHISRYEKNQSIPSIEVAMKISELYGVTLDWIYKGKEVYETVNNSSIVEEENGVYLTKDRYIELLESALDNTKKQNERLKNIESHDSAH